MLNTGKFTIFNRSGLAKMCKVNSAYYLSASEMRLHEVSCMTFNEAAYWSAVQHTSWSDFHNIFNAVQSEFQARGVQMLSLPWGWFHLCQMDKDPSTMDIQEKCSTLSMAICDRSFTEPDFEVRDRTHELDTSDSTSTRWFNWHSGSSSLDACHLYSMVSSRFQMRQDFRKRQWQFPSARIQLEFTR